MITCGWCNTHYTNWQSKCDSCGGPMPPMPGMELGPPPPPAPRELPKGFAFRTRFSGNIATLVGLVFFGVGSILTIAFLFAHPLAALFPLFFALGGFGMLRYGLTTAGNTLRAFREGIAVAGRVHSVGLDHTQQVNGKYPYKLLYHFDIGSYTHEGRVISFDSTLSQRRQGQPLWVLYVENAPDKNTLYPPVR